MVIDDARLPASHVAQVWHYMKWNGSQPRKETLREKFQYYSINAEHKLAWGEDLPLGPNLPPSFDLSDGKHE